MLNLRLQRFQSKEMLKNLELSFNADLNSIAAERIFLHKTPSDGSVPVDEIIQKLKEAQKMSYVFTCDNLICDFISEKLSFRLDKYEQACRYIFDNNISHIFKDDAENEKKYFEYLYMFFRALGDVFPSAKTARFPSGRFAKAVWHRFNVSVKPLLRGILNGSLKAGDCVTSILFPPHCGYDTDRAFEHREMLVGLLEERDGEYFLGCDDIYDKIYMSALFEAFTFREPENRLDVLARLRAFMV